MQKKTISVVCPCYNEEKNIPELCTRLKSVFDSMPQYNFEVIFIDNCSKDQTVKAIRSEIEKDLRVRAIVNVRNFGHIRSPVYGVLQAMGDAVVFMASDLQDPPELIPSFVKQWEDGYKVVKAVKNKSEESAIFFALRKIYYRISSVISEVQLTQNYTGFGLYDQQVIAELRKIDDAYPYFRGLISELGFEAKEIYFTQPTRKRGVSANNFYTLYDLALLGITSHSKVPLRLATMAGFAMSILSFLAGLGYLIAKLSFWDKIPLGIAPAVIGVFFLGSLQLFFVGIIGEYIGFVYTQVLKRPLVVEKERINFAAPIS
jgi:polyisoprenyl-phosphate glycosyltransferase